MIFLQVYQQPKKGLNAAYVHANNISSGDAVVVYFPKGTIPPRDVLKFRPFLEKGYGLVVASRQIDGSQNEEDCNFLKPRKWGVWFLSLFSMLVWKREGYWIRDVLHGIKGWNKVAFQKMQILDHGLSIDLEMVIRSYKLNIARTEFPTQETERSHGATNFKIIPTAKKLLSYLIFEIKRKT